jgi:ribosome-binding protein aMBF1 (putative translation factor)
MVSVNVVARSRLRPDNASGRTSRVGRIPQDVLKIRVRPETLAERVCRLRKARGWSQRALGAHADLHHAIIGKLEAGEARDLTAHTVARIAAGLGISIDDLWHGTGAAS